MLLEKLQNLQQWSPINLTPYSTKHSSRINIFRQTNVNVRTPLLELNKFRDLTTYACVCVYTNLYVCRTMHIRHIVRRVVKRTYANSCGL